VNNTTEQLTREQILAMSAGMGVDALVASRVFGHTVLGDADCFNEGGWLVLGEAKGDGGDRPAFLRRCICRERDNESWWPRALGHYASCLEVVPEYSEETADAWSLLEYFAGPICDHRAVIVSKTEEDGLWRCSIGARDDMDYDNTAFADTAALAICRAALLTTL
jgi:hypothetical protein